MSRYWHNPTALARGFATLFRTALARTEAFDLAVGIHGGATAGLRRTPDLAIVVDRAHSNAALHHAVSISYRATAFFRAKYLAVLIHRALTLSANDVAVLILDAIPCIDRPRKRQDQYTSENESIFHIASRRTGVNAWRGSERQPRPRVCNLP